MLFMLIISTLYILATVGSTKILTFFAKDLSILFPLTISNIMTGLLMGSVGATVGRLITNYILKNITYRFVFIIFFALSSIFFLMEFNFFITSNLYLYYFVRILQGLSCGVINIALHSYNAVIHARQINKYIRITTILTSGLGICTPLFSGLYIFFSLKTLIAFITLVPIIGSILSFFMIENIYLQHNEEEKLSIKILYKYLISRHLYMVFFAISCSCFILPVLIILTSMGSMTDMYWSSSYIGHVLIQYLSKNYVIKIINTIPLIIGSLGIFIPHKKRYFFIIFAISCGLLFFSYKNFFPAYNLDLLIISFIFVYSIHIVYIPTLVNRIFDHLPHKEFYGSTMHIIRSLGSIVLNHLFLQNMVYNNTYIIIEKILINLLLGILFYIIGVSLMKDKKKKNIV